MAQDRPSHMALVKPDCGLFDAPLWVDLPACRVFETKLVAQPRELLEPMPQLAQSAKTQGTTR